MSPTDDAFETVAVDHAERQYASQDAGDVVVPIHLASTFRCDDLPEDGIAGLDPDAGEYCYSRLANPTRRALERRLAALEGGAFARAFASGTAAITTALLATVEPGDHVVAFDDLYGGTKKLLGEVVRDRLHVDVTFVDARDPDAVADAASPDTELLWMETPTNPTLKLCDVEAMAAVAEACDATLAVDNTFASPYFQRPLDLGADLVAQSTTKFLNGHSDSLGGALITDDEALAEEVGFLQTVGLGNVLSPFDAYMVLRGIRTLPLRMERHEENARAVAEFLADDDRVEAVHYPGLSDHPQHDLARRQMDGFGSVLSIDLGSFAAAAAFVDGTEQFASAVSLGGVESLVQHPASMTHSELAAAEREAVGITDGLVRLSVGIEAAEDLLADLDRALDRARTGPPAAADR